MAKGFSRALLMKRRAAAKALRANAVEKAASLVSPESICVDGMSMALSCRYIEDASPVSGDALGSAEALVFLDSGDVAAASFLSVPKKTIPHRRRPLPLVWRGTPTAAFVRRLHAAGVSTANPSGRLQRTPPTTCA